MSDPRTPIVPPQKELGEEIRKLARTDPGSGCPRCGEPGQRFLRRCPKCGRRNRSLRNRVRSARKLPVKW